MKQLIVVLLALALVGGGIFWLINVTKKQQLAPAPVESGAKVPAAADKAGLTTKTGEVSSAGGRYYLQESGQSPKEIDSYVVQLETYVGQTVTVSGQYSGDTLFIGSVE